MYRLARSPSASTAAAAAAARAAAAEKAASAHLKLAPGGHVPGGGHVQGGHPACSPPGRGTSGGYLAPYVYSNGGLSSSVGSAHFAASSLYGSPTTNGGAYGNSYVPAIASPVSLATRPPKRQLGASPGAGTGAGTGATRALAGRSTRLASGALGKPKRQQAAAGEGGGAAGGAAGGGSGGERGGAGGDGHGGGRRAGEGGGQISDFPDDDASAASVVALVFGSEAEAAAAGLSAASLTSAVPITDSGVVQVSSDLERAARYGVTQEDLDAAAAAQVAAAQAALAASRQAALAADPAPLAPRRAYDPNDAVETAAEYIFDPAATAALLGPEVIAAAGAVGEAGVRDAHGVFDTPAARLAVGEISPVSLRPSREGMDAPGGARGIGTDGKGRGGRTAVGSPHAASPMLTAWADRPGSAGMGSGGGFGSRPGSAGMGGGGIGSPDVIHSSPDGGQGMVPHSRLTRGALLHVSGLPTATAKDTLLQLLVARGVGGASVPCRLALLQLGPHGKPAGTAYTCIRRLRDAHSLVGVHQVKGAQGANCNITVAFANTADVQAAPHAEFVVAYRTVDDGLLLTGATGRPSSAGRPTSAGAARRASGSAEDASPAKLPQRDSSVQLSLIETMHEGARVTSSMAAAALEELLGFGQERFAEERFVEEEVPVLRLDLAGLSGGGGGGD